MAFTPKSSFCDTHAAVVVVKEPPRPDLAHARATHSFPLRRLECLGNIFWRHYGLNAVEHLFNIARDYRHDVGTLGLGSTGQLEFNDARAVRPLIGDDPVVWPQYTKVKLGQFYEAPPQLGQDEMSWVEAHQCRAA